VICVCDLCVCVQSVCVYTVCDVCAGGHTHTHTVHGEAARRRAVLDTTVARAADAVDAVDEDEDRCLTS